MTYTVRSPETNAFKTVVTSVATSSRSTEETLARLDRIGLEPYVTEEGDLLVKIWTIAAEGFVSPEEAAIIRVKRATSKQMDELDWLSKNLPDIRRQFVGEWIAVYKDEIIDHTPILQELLNRISEFDKPLITFIPADPVVWTFTYAV